MKPEEMLYLERTLELAEEAVDAGDEPFGSVLVSAQGEILFEDRNRVGGGDHTRHPEFEIARWAANNLSPEQRRTSTVYTSGEHCPMCAAAHGWVGLGRIVYISSGAQLSQWLNEMGVPEAPVKLRPVEDLVPGIKVEGPVPALTERIYQLHRKARLS